MSKPYSLLFILFAFLVTACSQGMSKDEEAAQHIVDPFERVHLSGGGHLHVIPADHHAVELHGHKVSDTEVKVRGGKLYLTNKGSSGNQKLDIFIYTKNFNGLQITGGGTVNIAEGFAAVEKFDCSIHGGAKLALEPMEIGDLDISIFGGGSVTAHVKTSIQANIVGGGSIKYQGNPKVKSNILGGGSVKRL